MRSIVLRDIWTSTRCANRLAEDNEIDLQWFSEPELLFRERYRLLHIRLVRSKKTVEELLHAAYSLFV